MSSEELLFEDERSVTTKKFDQYTNSSRLTVELLDIDRFIKANDCKEITNPNFFDRTGIPTDDGLLSNSIFGTTQYDRSGIFAYINLGKYFLDPSCYKAWIRLNGGIIKDIIAKNGEFEVDPKGKIVRAKNGGSNGLEFLRKNIDKIKFESDDPSIKKDIKLKYLNMNKKKMFINKYLVIPPYYRDQNSSSRSGAVGVSEINYLYQQIIVIARSLKSTQEYGFDMSGDQELRMQEILLQIYDWFSGTTNKNIENKQNSGGISGKFGVLRRANQSKTADYASRLIITAPELKVNSPKEMKANFDKSAIPLASAMACFAPFIQYIVREFFDHEFIGGEQRQFLSKDGKIKFKTPKDPLIVFSDDEIKKQMEQFIHGYNNRLIPVEVPMTDGTIGYMEFKGRFYQDQPQDPGIRRRLTWLDIFYMAAVEATTNRMVLITRFPVDSRTNQITTGVVVNSTNETEPMYVNDTFYPYYPKFKDSDIGRDTSDMFVDSLQMSNLYLKGLGGDFDGDSIVIKGVFTDEANIELKNFMMDKKNFIGFGCKNLRFVEGDSIQSLYCLTKILSDDKKKLSVPEF